MFRKIFFNRGWPPRIGCFGELRPALGSGLDFQGEIDYAPHSFR